LERSVGARGRSQRVRFRTLLPTPWLQAAINRAAGSITELLVEVEQAGASAHASCIALSRLFPAGHVWALLDDEDSVVVSGQSPGSGRADLTEGQRPDFERLARFAHSEHNASMAGWKVKWWDYEGAEPDEADSPDLWPADLMDELLEDYIGDDNDRAAARRSVNGIGGAAKNSASDPSNAGEIALQLRRAFTKQRRLPDEMLDDERFRRWIELRAVQLSS
jgi:hypothetical protein